MAHNTSQQPVILTLEQRDAVREGVGHIFAFVGDDLAHDYLKHDRERVHRRGAPLARWHPGARPARLGGRR